MKFFLWVGLFLFLMGCEGPYPGDRTFSLTDLSGPYRMRQVEIEGSGYLGVLNTDYRGQYGDGSIHFYSLGAPTSLSLDENLSLRVPSNSADFFYDTETKSLFVLSRNTSQIVCFELTPGAGFSPTIRDGQKLMVNVFLSPQSFSYFEVAEPSKRLLAVSSRAAGSLQFFDLETKRLLNREEIEVLNAGRFSEGENLDQIFSGTAESPGAVLNMAPRRQNITEFPTQEGLGLSIRSRNIGLGELVYLGGEKHNFVAASNLDTALFNFQFFGFKSSSNFLWDLRKFINGYKVGELDFPGTRDSGFMGLAKDGDGNVYLTSRADNSLYALNFDLTTAAAEDYQVSSTLKAMLNTSVFRDNVQAYRLSIDFDSNPNDKVFPRLSHLSVNNQEAGTASRAYVLGLQDPREKESKSRIYLVDLSGNSILATFDFLEGDYPQSTLLLEESNLLMVSLAGSDKLMSFDVSGDAFAKIQEFGFIDSPRK
jgi:hypothetical protein